MTVPLRAALYLRVSTARQAEHDVSIPDQRKQGEAYCLSRGLELVDTFVEAGASATNDRRPEFQRMIEAGTSKPAPFDVVVVHSFSGFFRDHFELEFYVRKLAKNGVKLLSITQEMGDDPMHVMMRQIMALYDAIESGVADLDDPALKDRIDGLKASRDQARADAERASALLLSSSQQAITPTMLRKFASTARRRIRLEGGGYRRDHLRALAQRVEVDRGEIRIMGSKSNLLRVLAANGVGTTAGGVPTVVPKWRSGRLPEIQAKWLT
jgi:hypothetical protein